MLDFVTGLPHYFLSFLLVLTLLVFVHEWGHFLVARRCGVRVDVFSIGFGPELFGYTDRRGTRWKFSALPLGGYVKMFGDTNFASLPDGSQRPLTAEERMVAFQGKSLLQRSAIVFGGPLANFLLTIVLLAVLYGTYGQQVSQPVVGTVEAGSAADEAGLQPGDRIVSLNGAEVERFEDIAAKVQLGLDAPLDIVVVRGDERLSTRAVPRIIEEMDFFGNARRVGRLGVRSAGRSEVIRHDPLTAVWLAVVDTYDLSATTLTAVGQMIAGSRSADELGGIIRIAKMSGDVTEVGWVAFLAFSAVLSVNLGLINLFPVPMLDGGHLAYYAVEAVRGRPLGARAQEWGFRIGLALVVGLFLLATRNDLMSFPVVADFINRLIT